MALTFQVKPGYQFSASERVTYGKLNLLGTPGLTLEGKVDSSEIADGAITTQKLASSLDVNSKTDDHNLALTKLAQGTHGQILYYDSAGDLVTLPPGTDGYFLKTKGADNDPEWSAQAGVSSIDVSQLTTDGPDKLLATDSGGSIEWRSDTGLLPSVATSGSIAYFNGSAWVSLGLGANGKTLQSNGTAPVWDDSSASSFAAKGRFAATNNTTMTSSGTTNIASITWNDTSNTGTLTINFTANVAVDLPLFVRVVDGATGTESTTGCKTNSRTLSGIVLQVDTAYLSTPVFNVMIVN